MDPHIVFDCQNILPNRFALSLAAAARTRALRRGAKPRLDPRCASASEMALQEIACGAFADDEMAPFLFASQAGACFLPPPAPTKIELRGDGLSSTAAAPVASSHEAVDR
ncbi:DNA-directed RNA polymerase subunit omega [Rhizobium lentis]|uniref:DNA-directed RNA polymerase subunit omega n=1 Tax=Rhizobium TaxID=379 RepID=UPI00160C4733|nr:MULTISPECIES: DNA-directed RNA polymerase subunit omega [Rhizobium]MBB3353814.1 DNA-directed RNA polymerase subunit omega [Rhizobium sp. BK049]MBX5133956.1 DNA-directed RNA polymerase subunit omega [Rhizobium lentis]MBX5139822.1 DNA-directed RNA polymerase subunit omega [Rhizobium lentis]MBX5177915.1 DNA-directed RNA polymerase subunit omega [Rhizobium lentis]